MLLYKKIVAHDFRYDPRSNIKTIINQFKNYCIKTTWLMFICEIKIRSLFDWQFIDEWISVHSFMFYWTRAVVTSCMHKIQSNKPLHTH